MSYRLDFGVITPDSLVLMGSGMLVSLEITATAMAAGIAGGTAIALMRVSGKPLLARFAGLYTSLFRAVPLVMVLLWFFLIVPQLLQAVLNLSPTRDLRLASALVAFSLFEAAYFAEIVRAGIQSVGGGQMAAALALGMTRARAMRHIVLPQAFRNMVPLLLTQGIILFQDTSLVYVSALADFFGRAYGIGERDGRIVEMILFAGAVYFVICSAASLGVKRLTQRATT